MHKFKDKVVVVTGGASGIGAATVDAFWLEGARVAALDIKERAEKAPDGVRSYPCDVADETSVEATFDRVVSEIGNIDVVVHSAAVLGGSGPFHQLNLDTWNRYINTNLSGSFLVSRAAASRMVAQGTKGRIILVGSVNSVASERGAAPYASSKGGIRMLTRSAAVDLAPYGITVNMILPGPITTPATRKNFEQLETRRIFERVLPGGLPGLPTDIAAAALFLASPESRFVTGTDLLVDGGMFAQILN
ncbi:SDR family NAD(P)-dependent oxidoreductase [Mesorhizobium sp. VK23B]|uniref:SDR family NAD(P)-dependent oxidoreductase n=1 Tax=Mesorhizobium dulcispinae TaxID=3072316 RepID=A0ABU4X9N1_9HYPH|nr:MULTISPECIES: SDR family NAD(P)-dependent oxidoreductase [unclassified Mesorhizobium]MDX8465686.1 SDR family NAD(P)-dependent oxidoreductase [Mesorhizobium sp. VK23B]MDX8471512.1 SDR family NAD(P)-dependent oxidoreductase [Mesorhizobium sp. VK23A]